MFQIAAQIPESDLGRINALKGHANTRPEMLASVTYQPGTLNFVRFVGDKHGDKYTGHLFFEVLDEPRADNRRADLALLLGFAAGGHTSDVTDPPVSDDTRPAQLLGTDDPSTNPTETEPEALDSGQAEWNGE